MCECLPLICAPCGPKRVPTPVVVTFLVVWGELLKCPCRLCGSKPRHLFFTHRYITSPSALCQQGEAELTSSFWFSHGSHGRAFSWPQTEMQEHMENLLHNHPPKLDSRNKQVTKNYWLTAGEVKRVKQSELLNGCYWQNRDELERSKVVFNVKDEWLLPFCTRHVEYFRAVGCCHIVLLSFRSDI